MQLPVTDVDPDDLRGPRLQEAVGKAAGRQSDVERHAAAHVEPRLRERAGQLQPAARHVTVLAGQAVGCRPHFEVFVERHDLTGFLHGRLGPRVIHAAGVDETLSGGARCSQPSGDEGLIGTKGLRHDGGVPARYGRRRCVDTHTLVARSPPNTSADRIQEIRL